MFMILFKRADVGSVITCDRSDALCCWCEENGYASLSEAAVDHGGAVEDFEAVAIEDEEKI